MARRPHQKDTANLSGQGVGSRDAISSGLACQAEVRGPEQARRLGGGGPGHPPSHDALAGSGPGEVACLRATHRQVNDGFVGPLAGLVTRQAFGLVGGRSEARRLGGCSPVYEAMRVRLHLDEDVDIGLTAALRQGGIDVLTTLEAGNTQQKDDWQRAFATRSGRAFFTHSRSDFARLHTTMMKRGDPHTGIIPSDQLPLGTLIRRRRESYN